MNSRYQDLVAIVPEKRSENIVHICWMLHDQCNHKCSYCHPANYGGSYKWLKHDMAIRFIDNLLSHFVERKILISFTGGEPTIWPGFLDLCEYLNLKGISIGLTTNGSRRADFFRKLGSYLEFASVSFHPAFSDSENFIENLKVLSDQCAVGVRVMIPSESELWQKSVDFLERLKRSKGLNAVVEPVRVLKDFGTTHPKPTSYETWQENYLNKNSFTVIGSPLSQSLLLHADAIFSQDIRERLNPTDLVNQGMAKFEGWKCYIGLEHIFINQLGEVLRAGCREGSVIGHISEEKIKFPKKPLICGKSFCHCTTDVMVRKYKTTSSERLLQKLQSQFIN